MAQRSWFRAAGTATLALIIALTVVVAYSGTTADAVLEFHDDDGSVHESAIEALAAAGVTYGCGPGTFCPNRPLSRAEAASLMVRALGLNPAPGQSTFSDAVGSIHEPDIAALQAAGISNGCSAATFCTEDPISRADLAVLIERAFGLAPSDGNTFGDDDGLRSEPAIESLVAAGVAKGCNSWKFCPASNVTRGEAASFLARSMKLATDDGNTDPALTTPETSTTGGAIASTTTSTTTGSTTTTGVTTTTAVPAPPPSGSVVIPPGASIGSYSGSHPEGTIFILSPGTYVANRIYPKSRQQFIGGPGVIISGEGVHDVSFSGDAAGVVIDGLVIERYANSPQFGAIHTGGRDWVIRNSEFRYNAGAGVAIASGFQLVNNKIHHNGQIGVVGSRSVGALIEGNEIAFNNYEDRYDMAWEAGGTKFVESTDLVIRDNFVHDNHGAGLWTDGSNLRTVYRGNRAIDNYGPGIFHEISYDATIVGNYLEGNGHRFYSGGILVTESSNVTVADNIMIDNHGGVVVIDSNRGSGDHGVHDVTGLVVENNVMSYSVGWSGIRDLVGDGAVYTHGNVFRNNTYQVDSASQRWFWHNRTMNFAEWTSVGMS